MARIRTVKPEFWTDERLSALPEATHMLAAALLNYADDEGFFNAHPGLIKAACSPLREPSVSIHESLIALSNLGYIELTESPDGRTYGRIVSFAEHQRVNRPTPSKIKELCVNARYSVMAHGVLSEDSPPERNGEQGTGNRENRSPSGERFARAPEDGPSDADPVTSQQTDAPQASARQLEPTETGAAAKALREAGVPDAAPHRPELRAALADGIPVAEMADTARELAVAKPHPKLAYVLATVRGRRSDADRSPTEKLHAAKAHPGRESASDRVARINREAEARERIGAGRIIEGGLGHAA